MKSLVFNDIFDDVSRKYARLPNNQIRPDGAFPVIDQGNNAIAGYQDDPTLCTDLGAVVVFGDHTRIVKYAEGPFTVGADGTKVLRPKDGIHPKFAYRWLQSRKIPSLGYSRHFKLLKELSAVFPTLDDQERIAGILDKADALRTIRREAIAHLDTLSQSIFHEMFGDEAPNGNLSDAIMALVGGRNVVGSEDSSNPKRVLKISAVTSGTYLESESKPLPDEYVPGQEHVVQAGDVLISRANTTELVGASALVEQTDGNVVLPDKLWRAVPASAVDSRFLVAALQSSKVRAQVSRRSTGSGGSMKNISKPKLLGIPVHIPRLEPQREFAGRISAVDSLKAIHRAQLTELDDLFLSLQDRAFKGEL